MCLKGIFSGYWFVWIYGCFAANRPGFTYEQLLPGDTSSHVIDSLEEDKKYTVNIYAVFPEGPSKPVSIVGKTCKCIGLNQNAIIMSFHIKRDADPSFSQLSPFIYRLKHFHTSEQHPPCISMKQDITQESQGVVPQCVHSRVMLQRLEIPVSYRSSPLHTIKHEFITISEGCVLIWTDRDRFYSIFQIVDQISGNAILVSVTTDNWK